MTLPFAIPALTTDRLHLREPRETDLAAMNAFTHSPRHAFLGGPQEMWETYRGLLAGIGQWALRGFGFWSVDTKAGVFVGRVGVICPHGWPEPELAWHLYDGHEGQGFAVEAARAVRAHWATQGKGALMSLIHPDNARSIATAIRLGATFEGVDVTLGKGLRIFRHPGVNT